MQIRRQTQAQRRAQTSRQLLDAGADAFAERGYHGASLELISERAGVTKGALYHHFGSKEGLFLALLDERYDARLSQANDVDLEHASDVLPFDRQLALLFLEFVCVAAREPTVRARLAERLRALRARASQQLADDQLATLIGVIANGASIEALIFGATEGQATFDTAMRRLNLPS